MSEQIPISPTLSPTEAAAVAARMRELGTPHAHRTMTPILRDEQDRLARERGLAASHARVD